MTKPTKWLCAQRRLRSAWAWIRPVRWESSLCAQWVAKDPSFLHADSEDSDQTGRMPRLIRVFAGRTAILLVLSCRGSNEYYSTAPSPQKEVIEKTWMQIYVCYEIFAFYRTHSNLYNKLDIRFNNHFCWFLKSEILFGLKFNNCSCKTCMEVNNCIEIRNLSWTFYKH